MNNSFRLKNNSDSRSNLSRAEAFEEGVNTDTEEELTIETIAANTSKNILNCMRVLC
jgi:hypothetical protein